jgi:probable F420-dependent oxidoreductase
MPAPATTSTVAPRPRLGLVLPVEGVRLGDHGAVVGGLTDAGYTDVWAGETNGLDAVTPLAAAAAWNPALRIGTGVVPAATRGPAVLAMTAAALGELAPGRFSLGIGASSPVAVEDWNAGVYDRPVARVRDTVRFLRQALAGGRVDSDFETFSVRGFRLARVPDPVPGVLVAALRPNMLAIARDEADGAITTCLAASDVAEVAAILGPARRLVSWLLVCPSPDADRVRAWARPWLTAYLCVPAYAELHRWLGRAEMLAPAWQAWERGDRAAATGAVPDHLIDDLVIHGSPEECAEGIRRYVRAGVGEPVISVRSLDGDPVAAVRAVGEAFQR